MESIVEVSAAATETLAAEPERPPALTEERVPPWFSMDASTVLWTSFMVRESIPETPPTATPPTKERMPSSERALTATSPPVSTLDPAISDSMVLPMSFFATTTAPESPPDSGDA